MLPSSAKCAKWYPNRRFRFSIPFSHTFRQRSNKRQTHAKPDLPTLVRNPWSKLLCATHNVRRTRSRLFKSFREGFAFGIGAHCALRVISNARPSWLRRAKRKKETQFGIAKVQTPDSRQPDLPTSVRISCDHFELH